MISKNSEINVRWRSRLKQLKGPVQCFSMLVVINKCILLNPEKNWRRSVLEINEKTVKLRRTLIPKK